MVTETTTAAAVEEETVLVFALFVCGYVRQGQVQKIVRVSVELACGGGVGRGGGGADMGTVDGRSSRFVVMQDIIQV